MVASLSPWALINAPADRELLSTAERSRIADLGYLCSRFGWRLLAFSSDRVFNGLGGSPYDEYDKLSPQDELGFALESIEKHLLEIHPDTLIARSGPILDATDPSSFGIQLLSKLMFGPWPPLLADVIVSPAYISDLINGALDLLIDGERGLWHLANRGHLSVSELTNRLCKETGLNAPRAILNSEHTPRSFALVSRRGWITPTIDSAIFALFACLQSRYDCPARSVGNPLVQYLNAPDFRVYLGS